MKHDSIVGYKIKKSNQITPNQRIKSLVSRWNDMEYKCDTMMNRLELKSIKDEINSIVKNYPELAWDI